jgi:hypothetical protein
MIDDQAGGLQFGRHDGASAAELLSSLPLPHSNPFVKRHTYAAATAPEV